jgi:hypothetical protein
MTREERDHLKQRYTDATPGELAGIPNFYIDAPAVISKLLDEVERLEENRKELHARITELEADSRFLRNVLEAKND